MSQSFRGVPSLGGFRSIGDALMRQSMQESGWHKSPSDLNTHLTIKNADGQITGHYEQTGVIKDFNGSLAWLQKLDNK